MTFRDFDPDRLARLAAGPDPIEFGLAGRRFRCLPVPPPGAVQMLAELPDLPPREDPGYLTAILAAGRSVAQFIRATVIPPHRGQWDDVMLNEFVDDETLVDLLDWLADEYRTVLQSALSTAPPEAPLHGDLVARARRLAGVVRMGGEVAPPAVEDVDGRRVWKLAAVLLADPDADLDGVDPDALPDDLVFGAD